MGNDTDREAQSETLLAALKKSRHPNCTLYLIWHYVNAGDLDAARLEYRVDHDKLGCHRGVVETVLGITRNKVL